MQARNMVKVYEGFVKDNKTGPSVTAETHLRMNMECLMHHKDNLFQLERRWNNEYNDNLETAIHDCGKIQPK